jgi:hypothetical protein
MRFRSERVPAEFYWRVTSVEGALTGRMRTEIPPWLEKEAGDSRRAMFLVGRAWHLIRETPPKRLQRFPP